MRHLIRAVFLGRISLSALEVFMLFRRFAFSLVALSLLVLGAGAPAFGAASGEGTNQQNLLSIGGGWFDFDRNSPRRAAADFRLEHRWGMSLLPMASSLFEGLDTYFQVHPMVALETTHRGQLYGGGGFAFDFLVGRNVVITPTALVGLYFRGDGKHLGSVVEFRSGLEAGWRFDNDVRLTGFISHVSNAGLTSHNPGANTVGGYVHIPTSMLFGK